MSFSKYDRIPAIHRIPTVKYRVVSVGEKRSHVIGYVRAGSNHEATVKARAKFGVHGFSHVEQI